MKDPAIGINPGIQSGFFLCRAQDPFNLYNSSMQQPQVRVGITVFVIRNGSFILLRRKGSHGQGTWSLPGGHLECGESCVDAARREVMEETNLKIKNVRFSAVTNDIFTEENKHYVTVWMQSEWASGNAENMEPEKCTAQSWHTFDTLPQPLFHTWNQLLDSSFLPNMTSQLES
jgi:8-oxo-dGTP diphosphatase